MSFGFKHPVAGGSDGLPARWAKALRSVTVRKTFLASMLGAVMLACLGAAAEGRLAPPEKLPCSRDRLTAFSGKVTSYKRGAEKIALRVRTDEATTETFTLKYPKAEGPVSRFLLQGGPFREADWVKVESGPGRLRDGMRAIVWICEDDPRPIYDWRPGEGSEEAPPNPAPR